MKYLCYFLSVFLFITTKAYTQNTHDTQNSTVSVSGLHSTNQTYLPLVLSPGLDMRNGAQNIITIHNGISSLEDRLIGTRWFSETDVLGKTGGIIGRFMKYSFLDVPVDYFSVVLSHEYFGHGARYRELDMDNIQYGFDWPPPYGNGGGEAVNNEAVTISTHELLSIWEGGLEVHPLMNRNLSLRWMAKNEMTYREASQYFWSFQISWVYLQDTNEDLSGLQHDNDPQAYVRIINEYAGYPDVHDLKMSVKDLKSKMRINAANPFIFYSVYSILKTFLWDGNISNNIPTIDIGQVHYLPSFGAGLTPFGVQYHLDNFFRCGEVTFLVNMRYGDRTFYDSWGGVGIHANNLFSTDNNSVDIDINVWKQPGLKFNSNQTEVRGKGLGGSISLRGYYDFRNIRLPVSAVLELGYKSTGFLYGYTLQSSPIFSIGLAYKG